MRALSPVRALVACASSCVAATALVACGGAHDCTLIGGLDGVGVEVPASLYVPSGKVVVEVCDDQCASTTQVLAKLPGSPGPTGRGASASFHALGRTFEPGTVTVTASLYGPRGALVARREQQVTLEHEYPNGKDCDDGFVHGSMSLRPGDRD